MPRHQVYPHFKSVVEITGIKGIGNDRFYGLKQVRHGPDLGLMCSHLFLFAVW